MCLDLCVLSLRIGATVWEISIPVFCTSPQYNAMQAQSSRGNARPNRGGNRGGPRRSFQGRQNLPSVPSRTQVIPGAGVSIVLKEDQPTGREVQGTVQDVLTSGDHPRGIKVRLTDGRVGRVQRMASTPIPEQSAPVAGGFQVITEGPPTTSRQQLRYRDVRLDEEPEEPPSNYDLSAFIKVAKPKKKSAKAAETTVPPAMATCPVCSQFEGDEAAVAHHVATHFQ